MFLFSVKITLKLQLFPIVYHLLKTKIGSKNPPNMSCAHVIYVYHKLFKDFRKYMTIKDKYELKGSCMLTKTNIRTVLQRKMCQLNMKHLMQNWKHKTDAGVRNKPCFFLLVLVLKDKIVIWQFN